MSTIEKAAAKLASRKKQVPDLSLRNVDASRFQSPSPSETRKPFETVGRFCEIDLQGFAEKGFLVPGDGRSQLAHEMRRIKRPLLLNIQRHRTERSMGPPPNLVMITSSLPGEGKTFISINLAVSLSAELDRRVLLVDADVSKGSITEELGIQARRGLSDLLHEVSYIGEDAVLTSNIDRLSILPAGGVTDHVDELFASDMMRTITQSLAEADPDRIILFDSPPLLATTESAVLARNMGQVVLIVEANKTSQDAVKHSLDRLEGCANVSLILNKSNSPESNMYGYGYGYGGSERRPAGAGYQGSDRSRSSLDPHNGAD